MLFSGSSRAVLIPDVTLNRRKCSKLCKVIFIKSTAISFFYLVHFAIHFHSTSLSEILPSETRLYFHRLHGQISSSNCCYVVSNRSFIFYIIQSYSTPVISLFQLNMNKNIRVQKTPVEWSVSKNKTRTIRPWRFRKILSLSWVSTVVSDVRAPFWLYRVCTGT